MNTLATTTARSSATASRANTVRMRILGEHRRLRDRLDVLELAVDALREEVSRRASVKRAARDMLHRLIAHTLLEDAILAPVLRSTDAWGEARAQSMLEHHEQQRNELKALIHSYDDDYGDVEVMALRTLTWIADVRADMDHEERTVLSRELLDAWNQTIDGEAG